MNKLVLKATWQNMLNDLLATFEAFCRFLHPMMTLAPLQAKSLVASLPIPDAIQVIFSLPTNQITLQCIFFQISCQSAWIKWRASILTCRSSSDNHCLALQVISGGGPSTAPPVHHSKCHHYDWGGHNNKHRHTCYSFPHCAPMN